MLENDVFPKSLLSINFSKNAHFIEEIGPCPRRNLRPLFLNPSPEWEGLPLKHDKKWGKLCAEK